MPITLAIVDDQRIVRNSLREKLASSPDLEILFEAGNGEEFLEKMKGCREENWPQLVLMDLEMPGMGGIQAISMGSILYPKVRFLVLTIFDDNEKIFEAIQAGASGYLLKDGNMQALREAITNILTYDGVPMSPAIARKALAMLKSATAPLTSKEPLIPDSLSRREFELLRLLVEGLDYRQIAEKLIISPSTVRTHIAHIYHKLHINSKIQAARLAFRNRWL